MGRIYVLVALSRYEDDVSKQFGVKALALDARPLQEVVTFINFGDYEAYFITPEHQLNAFRNAAFWTPVHLWWVLDFDAPEEYPVVMYQGAAPVENAVPNTIPNRASTGENTPNWWEDGGQWTEGQKRLLKFMIDNPLSVDWGQVKLGKAAGVGVETAKAVRAAVQEDKRLLNGLGQKILGAQS